MATKFKLSIKIQGLEIEVEGAREDAALMAQSVHEQLGGLLQSAGTIIDGDKIDGSGSAISKEVAEAKSSARKNRKRRQSKNTSSPDDVVESLTFRHEPEKYGTPRQEWSTAEKSIWTMYVTSKFNGDIELSSKAIASLFNRHFKQSKVIDVSNVTRDLGKLKVKSPSQVTENAGKRPSTWYLTSEGISQAETLISKILEKVT